VDNTQSEYISVGLLRTVNQYLYFILTISIKQGFGGRVQCMNMVVLFKRVAQQAG
jgi:hypothetical protein